MFRCSHNFSFESPYIVVRGASGLALKMIIINPKTQLKPAVLLYSGSPTLRHASRTVPPLIYFTLNSLCAQSNNSTLIMQDQQFFRSKP